MANGIYQRSLFGGNAPPPPSSVGVGITSGLEAPMMDPMATPVQDPQQQLFDRAEGEAGMSTAAGLQAAAESMQELYGELDNAESIEEVINSLRGDEQPMSARYSELAEMVGEADAKKTPESVLALLQPTFQIMEVMQQNVPEGGIGNAPMMMGGGEQAAEDFSGASSVQAPRSEEAMLRIAMGEQPVMRQDGSPPTGEVVPFSGPMLTAPASTPSNTGFRFTGTTVPTLQGLPNMGTAQNVMTDYMNLVSPYLQGVGGGSDANSLIDYRMGALDPYMVQPRTREEILADQQAFFGDADTNDAQVQALLALAKYGSQISQTPGSLLQGLVKPAGEFAADLSKVAAQKTAQERRAKEFAYSTAESEQAQRRNAELQIAMGAINQAASGANSFAEARLDAAKQAATLGLTLSENERDAANRSLELAWTANNQYGVTGTETFMKPKQGGGFDIIAVRRTADGPRMLKDGNLVAIPEGYYPADATTFRAATASGGIDFSEADRVDLLVPDSQSRTGFRQVPGIYANGAYFVSPDGNPRNAFLAPAGFIQGTESDVLSVSPADSVGRVYATVTAGSLAGRTFLTAINDQPVGGVAFELEEPVYETNAEGQRTLARGNPMVENVGRSGVTFGQLSPQQVENAQRKVSDMTAALAQGNDVLSAIPQAVGPLNSVKSFTSNAIAAFAPDSWDGMLEYAQTDRGRQKMSLFGRTLARAAALSDRYAVAEQTLITSLAEDPEGFFRNPEMSAVRFQELLRTLQNELSENRALLGDTDILRVREVPTGTVNDPFLYTSPGHFEYLSIAAANGGNLDGMYMRMTASEAQQAGLPEDLWRGKEPGGLVDLRLSNRMFGRGQ